MQVTQPIFIIGTGRSGSTIFQDVFAAHHQLTWLSRLQTRFPARATWNQMAINSRDWPLVGPVLREQLRPSEPYAFWDHIFAGFTEPYRDLRADDVTPRIRADMIAALETLPTPQRPRLLLKVTGWSRLGFLNAIFPDAKFIHLIRDGRAVANSLLQVPWWHGWQGPHRWRFGPLSAENQALWEQHDESFVALAGIAWNILTDSVYTAKDQIDPDRFLHLSYEDLCADPLSTFRRAVEFCDLPWSDPLETAIAQTPLRNTNHKWRQDLTPAQQRTLQTVTTTQLAQWGYDLVDFDANVDTA